MNMAELLTTGKLQGRVPATSIVFGGVCRPYHAAIAERETRKFQLFAKKVQREVDQQNERFKQDMVSRLPGRMGKRAILEWGSINSQVGEQEANRFLLKIGMLAKATFISPDASDGEICELAKQKAREAGGLLEAFQGMAVRGALVRLCHRCGVNPPGEDLEDGEVIARVTSEFWWRSKLRRVHGKQAESLARHLGYVHSKVGLYCSDEALMRRQQQNKRNRETLEATELVCVEDGEVMNLADIADTGLANKALRRAELLTRAKGCEQIANDLGHVALFFTVTCPSRMHARHRETGARNERFDGSTPSDGHQYIQRNWQCIRAKFKRKGVLFYGIRIAEPHHDGTTHWHVLMFVRSEDRDFVVGVMHEYAMRESPNEPGASQYRFKVDEIKKEAGAAVGYLIKYVCKNIDGEGVGETLEGIPAPEGAARVEAWARAHGVRQFQGFGVPPVSVWRELRRIQSDELSDAPDTLIRAHASAQKTDTELADYAGFVRACGGVCLKRTDYALAVAVEEKTIQGRYGLSTRRYPVGVVVRHGSGRVFRSNRRLWEPFGRSAKAGNSAPWTCVNNCTPLMDTGVQRVVAPWWKEELQWESTAKDADGFEIGFFGSWPEKRKGNEPGAHANSLPNHQRINEVFRNGICTA